MFFGRLQEGRGAENFLARFCRQRWRTRVPPLAAIGMGDALFIVGFIVDTEFDLFLFGKCLLTIRLLIAKWSLKNR